MQKIKLSEIKVGERFRKDVGDIDELKASMATRGLIQPVVVDRSHNLVAGGRRVHCAGLLGWVEVDCLYRDQLTPLEARLIELEENICRKDFTDEEKVNAYREIHRLKQAEHGVSTKGSQAGGWTVQDTADSLGVSKGLVGMYMQVAEAKDASPTVAEALKKDGISAAYRQMMHERANQVVASIVADLASEPASEKKEVERYFLGDSLEIVKQLPSDSFDIVFTDPPYGIDVGNMQMFGAFQGDIEYEDSPESVKTLIEAILPELVRVMKPNAFIFFWTTYSKIGQVEQWFQAAGLNTATQPFIWCKDQAAHYAPNQEQMFAYACEFGVYGWKGKPVLTIKGAPNYILCPPVPSADKLHPHEKPVEIQKQLLERFGIVTMSVLDPFAGSASVHRAATALGMKPTSIEKRDSVYNRTLLALQGTA